MKPLRRLFEPLRIGALEVKNRMAMAPMASDFAHPDGTLSRRIMDYYEARARGGVGLIILEVASIDEGSPYVPNTVGLWDDRFIPGLRGLTDALHRHGARVVCQMAHPGPESLAPFIHGTRPVGPSAVICHTTRQKCRELTPGEIARIVAQFGQGARRAREAGFDGIELHAAHNYMLVGSFLSPLRNRRIDRYGGCLDDRMTFPLEVLASMRECAGEDFPVIVRLSGDMGVEGGQDLRETRYLAPRLAEAGAAAFEISAGIFPEGMDRIIPPMGSPLRPNAGLSAAVRQVVDVPVLVVGRINDPRVAEDILARGEADMVVMGRALLADPAFPRKAEQGCFEDIAPCIGCGLGCVAGRNAGRDMTCLINPALGREREMALRPAARPRTVMVVGGGPAGLEAARVAALRGHAVTLFEREGQVGGQLNLAAVPPGKQEICKVPKYLLAQAVKAGVRFELDTEVDVETVEREAPDVLVLATGVALRLPDIPGIRDREVVWAHDVLGGKVDIAPGRVLVIGGGMVGCETAEAVADRGDNPLIGRTRVTIVEMLDRVALDAAPQNRKRLLERLRARGVEILTATRVKRFLADGVVVERGGQEETIRGVDRIILSTGVVPHDPLSGALRGRVPEVHVIGDAREAGSALQAIAAGAEIGRGV